MHYEGMKTMKGTLRVTGQLKLLGFQDGGSSLPTSLV